MQLRIKNFRGNASSMMRTCGYAFDKLSTSAFDRNEGTESSFMRRLAGDDYPRFHAYVQLINNNELIVNLHLDQKKPSYGGGTRAHSGEYDGPLIVDELKRIEIFAQRESGALPHKLEPW